MIAAARELPETLASAALSQDRHLMVIEGFIAFALGLPGERSTGRGDLSPRRFVAGV